VKANADARNALQGLNTFQWKPYDFWAKVTLESTFDDKLFTKIYPNWAPMDMVRA
jgi:hypothetical protein